MFNLSDVLRILGGSKQHFIEKYGVNTFAVFGSYSRGEQKPESDIDILVDFTKPIGIEFIDLADEIENLLGKKVDLVSKNGVKKDYLDYITPQLRYA